MYKFSTTHELSFFSAYLPLGSTSIIPTPPRGASWEYPSEIARPPPAVRFRVPDLVQHVDLKQKKKLGIFGVVKSSSRRLFPVMSSSSTQLLKLIHSSRLFAHSRRSAWAGARCPHPSLAAVLSLVLKKETIPDWTWNRNVILIVNHIRYSATPLLQFRYFRHFKQWNVTWWS